MIIYNTYFTEYTVSRAGTYRLIGFRGRFDRVLANAGAAVANINKEFDDIVVFNSKHGIVLT